MGETVCCRCGSSMALQLGVVLADVCDECLRTLQSTESHVLNDLLEAVDRPAALVSRDMTVISFNRRFERLFQRFDRELGGLKIGEAMDCANATSDKPCGQSPFCPPCGVRRLVEIARIARERISQIPMSFRHKSGLEQTYVFTTEKRGDATLLTIGTQ